MIVIHLFYTGAGDNARRFAEEMESSGLANAIERFISRETDGDDPDQRFIRR